MLRLVSEADTVIDGMLKYPNHIRDAERHWDAIQFVAVTPKSFFFSFFFPFSYPAPFLNRVSRWRKDDRFRYVSIFEEGRRQF